MKVPAIIPHKPLTPPTLIQEDSTVLGPGNVINNSIVQHNPVESLPQTLLGPTEIVTTTAGEAQTNNSPLVGLDNVSDLLVDTVNSAELTGLAISNILTLVGEASLLSAVGIAGLAPLISALNESKSESKEAASTSLPKANQEENARQSVAVKSPAPVERKHSFRGISRFQHQDISEIKTRAQLEERKEA